MTAPMGMGNKSIKKLGNCVDRYERIQGEIDVLNEDKKELMSEVDDAGFNKKAFKKTIADRRQRRKDPAEFDLQVETVELYMAALDGHPVDKPASGDDKAPAPAPEGDGEDTAPEDPAETGADDALVVGADEDPTDDITKPIETSMPGEGDDSDVDMMSPGETDEFFDDKPSSDPLDAIPCGKGLGEFDRNSEGGEAGNDGGTS